MTIPKQTRATQTAQVAAALQALQERGIDASSLVNALAGDVNAIERMAHVLLAPVLAHRAAARNHSRGREPKTPVRDDQNLPPATTGFLLSVLIEACARAEVAPPFALANVLRVHLGADTYAAAESKVPGAFDRAARYRLAFPEANQTEIAQHAGVARPNVTQWIQSGQLDRAAETLRGQGLEEFIRKTTPRA